MRPDEYIGLPNVDINHCHLFCLQDIQLWIVGHHCLQLLRCPLADLSCATFVSLTFTNQKSGICDKVSIGHQSHLLCPGHHPAHHLLLVRAPSPHHNPPQWPLHTPSLDLCPGHKYHGRSLGLHWPHRNIFRFSSLRCQCCHSLCACGAMALLCAHIDSL